MSRFLLLCACCVALFAQDARTVAEPSFPRACVSLIAQQTGDAVDESLLDTSRIQSALNGCPAGHAVELVGTGASNTFLTGPLTLPKGVTLLVDAGVTLLASRNPRDYDANTSHTCGTLQTSSGGCLPLITANRADGSGLM